MNCKVFLPRGLAWYEQNLQELAKRELLKKRTIRILFIA